MGRDIAWALAAMALAAAYYAAAAGVPASFLSDEVGAAGVPKALAVTLGVLGALALARAALVRAPPPSGAPDWRQHARALGLFLIGVLYVALTPFLGYLVATVLLILAVAFYAGAKPSASFVAVGAAGGLVLWLVFAKLLGVAMPAGEWPRLLG